MVILFLNTFLIFLDQIKETKDESVDNFLDVFRKGIDQSHFISMLMGELEQASCLMGSVKSIFDSNEVFNEKIDIIVQRIDNYLRSSFNANNSISWFRDEKHEIDEKERREIDRIFEGWTKNEHELRKRTQKYDHFRVESNEKLILLERSIQNSKERNDKFRKTSNETSARITVLIEQLHENTEKSDFIRKEIEIIDNTLGDLEVYKKESLNEHKDLEEKLFEKQSSLVEFLKMIDRNVDNSLSKHQQIFKKHEDFHEALEQLIDCFSEFEMNKQEILKRYNIWPVAIKIGSTPLKSSATDEETLRALEFERDEIIKKSTEIECENKILISDLEELFKINTDITDQNADMKKRLSENKKDAHQTEELIKKLNKTMEQQAIQIETVNAKSGNQEGIKHFNKQEDNLLDENESLRKLNIETKETDQENKNLTSRDTGLQAECNDVRQQGDRDEYEGLSVMLHETHRKSNNIIAKNKRLPSPMQMNITRRGEDKLNQKRRNWEIEKQDSSSLEDVDFMMEFFRDMGIDQLQYGSEYSVHYQVVTSNGMLSYYHSEIDHS